MIGFLYGQSGYQLLENSIKLEDYVSYLKDNSFTFASITDDNLISAYKFIKLCKEKGIKPIIGLRLKIESKAKRDNYVLFYAKSFSGFKNLVLLNNIYNEKKIVTDKDIKEHRQDIALITSSMESDLEYYLYTEQKNQFEEELDRLSHLASEFHMGIFASDMIYDAIYQDLINLYQNKNISFLPLNKACFFKEDKEAYLALLKIGGKEDSYIGDFYLKDQNKLQEDFKDVPFVFEYLEMFVNSCSDYDLKFEAKMPKYTNQLELDNLIYIKELAKKGLKKRLKSKNIEDKYDEYLKRLDYELKIISELNYIDYFLIVYDFVNYAKHNKIAVGPGRGSACGALLAYSLGITDVDPIYYNLYFERFLNKDRVSMPDIDIDFEDGKRMDVIKYVISLYGKNNVVLASTFQKFQIKNTVLELFRAFQYDTKYIDTVLSLVDKDDFEAIEKELHGHKELVKLIAITKRLEGLPKSLSTHPSGVILSSNSLYDNLPIRFDEEINQTYFEAKDLEELGYLKIDFLGVSNLSTIRAVLEEIKDKIPNVDLIKKDDKKTFELLSRADTRGIFQLESYGIKKVLRELKPNCLNDLIALLGLYRPGPMNMIDEYIERKNGKPFAYIDNRLEDILKETYGIIIYQEQIMMIVSRVANYSMNEADNIRRAITKKNKDVFENIKEDFIRRAIENGYLLENANNIYEEIVRFCGYGFNKSHSVAYSLFVYLMAYLKANYPLEFYAKILDQSYGNEKEIVGYISEIKKAKIKILNPDINKSSVKVEIINQSLLLPLNFIKGLGTLEAKKIVAERKKGLFNSLIDVKKRAFDGINKETIENIVYSLALKDFGKSNEIESKLNDVTYGLKSKDEDLEVFEDLSYEELEEKEKRALGFNITYDSFANYDKFKKEYKASDYKDLVLNKVVNVIGIITNYKEIKAKNDMPMAFITLNINHDFIECVMFSDAYQQYKQVLSNKKMVLVNGTVRKRNDELKIQIIKMKNL